MICLKKKGLAIKTFHLILIFVSVLVSSVSQATQVVAHPEITTNQLTTTQLRRIYTMRQATWADGKPIVVYTLPSSHPVHQRFTKNELKIFPYQLDKIWIKLTYSGLAQPPIKVKSIEQLIAAVQSTPGAIGYINDQTPVEGLKVIAMEASNRE